MSRIKKYISVFFIAFLLFSGILAFSNTNTTEASFFDFIKAFVTINPLAIEITAPLEVEVGERFRVEARAVNKGAVRIESMEGEIFPPAGVSIVGKNTIKRMGVLQGEKEKKIIWTLKGEVEGNYIFAVSASGEVNGDPITAEESKMIVVVEKVPVFEHSANVFKNFISFMRILF